MKESRAIVFAFACLIFLSTVCGSSGANGVIVMRHMLEDVYFPADTAGADAVWDLSGGIETGSYALRLRAASDSVFDITARGQRLDFRVSAGGIRLRGLENTRMRLADSAGLLFVRFPLMKGVVCMDTAGCFHSVGFSDPWLPDSLRITSVVPSCGRMLFPDGDSVNVARLDISFRHERGARHMSYWFADSLAVPVARQSVATDEAGNRRVTFSYTYPSEMEEIAEASRVLLAGIDGGAYVPGLFHAAEGRGAPGGGRGESRGGDLLRPASDGGSSEEVVIPLENSVPGETFTCTICDVRGVVWQTGCGITDFNSARVTIKALPTGWYLITVRTESGDQATVRHHHESL